MKKYRKRPLYPHPYIISFIFSAINAWIAGFVISSARASGTFSLYIKYNLIYLRKSDRREDFVPCHFYLLCHALQHKAALRTKTIRRFKNIIGPGAPVKGDLTLAFGFKAVPSKILLFISSSAKLT